MPAECRFRIRVLTTNGPTREIWAATTDSPQPADPRSPEILRVVIGGRGLKEGKLEIKWRTKEAAEMIPLKGAAVAIADLVQAERNLGHAASRVAEA